MTGARAAQIVVTISFAALIGSAGLVQTAAELRDGQRPAALEVFDQVPSAQNLHAFEHNLEDASLVTSRLRPWVQEAEFSLLSSAGEKAIVGREGWLFYRPSVRYMTERPGTRSAGGKPVDPFPAIKSFHDQLAARGIQLLVVPVPNKESVYPEMLSWRAAGKDVVVSSPTRRMLDRLRAAGVELVDLFEAFRLAKAAGGGSYPGRFYLEHDSHWTPAGMQIAVDAVARRISEVGSLDPGDVIYDSRPIQVDRVGDLLQMLQVPRLERAFEPAHLVCEQVMRRDTGRLYQDDLDARILVLGDSFLRIYEQDDASRRRIRLPPRAGAQAAADNDRQRRRCFHAGAPGPRSAPSISREQADRNLGVRGARHW